MIRLFFYHKFLDTRGIFPYYHINSITPFIYAMFPYIIVYMDMSTDITFQFIDPFFHLVHLKNIANVTICDVFYT